MNKLESILYKSAVFLKGMKDIFSQYGFRFTTDFLYYPISSPGSLTEAEYRTLRDYTACLIVNMEKYFRNRNQEKIGN